MGPPDVAPAVDASPTRPGPQKTSAEVTATAVQLKRSRVNKSDETVRKELRAHRLAVMEQRRHKYWAERKGTTNPWLKKVERREARKAAIQENPDNDVIKTMTAMCREPEGLHWTVSLGSPLNGGV